MCWAPICGACHSLSVAALFLVVSQGVPAGHTVAAAVLHVAREIGCVLHRARVCAAACVHLLGCRSALLLLFTTTTIAYYSRLLHRTNPVVLLHRPHGVIAVPSNGCCCSVAPPAPSVVAVLPPTPTNQPTSAQHRVAQAGHLFMGCCVVRVLLVAGRVENTPVAWRDAARILHALSTTASFHNPTRLPTERGVLGAALRPESFCCTQLVHAARRTSCTHRQG